MENNKRFRPSRKWMVWMGAAAAVSLVVLSLSIIFIGSDKDEKRGGAKVSAIRAKAESTVGGTPATDSYNARIKEQNELLAEEAKKEGKSLIPTVTGAERRPNVTKVEQKEPPKEVPVVKQPPKEKKKEPPPKDKQKENEGYKQYKATLLKDLKNIINQEETKYQPAATIMFAEHTVAKGESENDSSSAKSELPPLPFKSGELLYASNEILLNSDVPSPVVATIVSGAFKDATFFGNFKRHEKYMLLRFDRMRTPAGLSSPNGDEYPIDAIAIDMDTRSAAVRSSVDSHYLQRWGGIVAASFLEGFGDAVSRSGKTYQSNNFSETISYPEYSVEDQAWIAAGKVGERLAGVMEQGFNRPPTVYTDSKDVFAIMILSTNKR